MSRWRRFVHSVIDMTVFSTAVRATHLVTNAAWFGGSLMGAVGLNPAAREGDDDTERAQISDRGWTAWGPVQGGAIGLHVLSGLAIVADNRRRTLAHPPTTAAVVLKTALTGAALAASAAAYLNGARLGRAQEAAAKDPAASARKDEPGPAHAVAAVGDARHDGGAARARRLPR